MDKRKEALDAALKIAENRDNYSADDIVKNAEKFYQFLVKDDKDPYEIEWGEGGAGIIVHYSAPSERFRNSLEQSFTIIPNQNRF